VLGRVSMLVAAGVVTGTVISVWASKFVVGLIYGLEPRDSGTVAGAAFVLCATSAIAAWLPTRRAVRIDPAAVLRES
jgi:putative ABC transport system permease protein